MTDQSSETIGHRLRAARERAGLSLRHIADVTKLPLRSLDALEANRVGYLPGGIYRRAIVRAYATEVGLDAEVTLRAFLAEYPDDLPPLPPLPTRKPTSYDLPPQPDVKPERSRFWRAALSLLGAVIPIAAGVFYFTIGLRGADVPRHVADITSTRGTWQPEIVPSSAVETTTGRPLAVMISVSSRCDLQVVADGREVLGRFVTPGEVLQLGLSDEIVLAGSNAGAVHLSFNGRPGRQLGTEGTPFTVRIGRDDLDAWLAQ